MTSDSDALSGDPVALWTQFVELLTPVAVETLPTDEHIAIAERLLRAGIIETLISIMTYSAPFAYNNDPRETHAQGVSLLLFVRDAKLIFPDLDLIAMV